MAIRRRDEISLRGRFTLMVPVEERLARLEEVLKKEDGFNRAEQFTIRFVAFVLLELALLGLLVWSLLHLVNFIRGLFA